MLIVSMARSSSDYNAMLCSAGFVDDVMFLVNGVNWANRRRRYVSSSSLDGSTSVIV